jgi:preprotein translocase subunit SecG
MLTFLLVVHVLVTLGMVGSILLQRSEGGGFVSSASSFMTARGSANFLTRLTAIFAATFIILSLILAIIAGGYKKNRSILEGQNPGTAVETPIPGPSSVESTPPPGENHSQRVPAASGDAGVAHQNDKSLNSSNP